MTFAIYQALLKMWYIVGVAILDSVSDDYVCKHVIEGITMDGCITPTSECV